MQEENKKGKHESTYILQADDSAVRDLWIYYLDVVAAVNFYASNPKLNSKRNNFKIILILKMNYVLRIINVCTASRRFVEHCELILQTSASYILNSVHFSRNTFLRGEEAKILEMNHQLCPSLFRLLEVS